MVLDIVVKTLDSHNYRFEADDDWTILQFKEHIQPTINIASNEQRLIFCGRVLQDDKKLTEYDCNGKVIHLVRRPPPSMASNDTANNSAQSPADSNNNSTTNNLSTNTEPGPRTRDEGNFFISAMTLTPEAVSLNVNHVIRHIMSLQQAFHSRPDGIAIGTSSEPISMTEIGRHLHNASRLLRITVNAINECMARIASLPPIETGSTGASTLDVQRRVITAASSQTDLQRINPLLPTQSSGSQATPTSENVNNIHVGAERDNRRVDRHNVPRQSLTTDDLPTAAQTADRVSPITVLRMPIHNMNVPSTSSTQQGETTELDRYLSILNYSCDLQNQFQGLARRYRQLTDISRRGGLIMPPGTNSRANSSATETTSIESTPQASNPAVPASLASEARILGVYVPRIMHHLGHLQHALSDFSVDFTRGRLLLCSAHSGRTRNIPQIPRTNHGGINSSGQPTETSAHSLSSSQNNFAQASSGNLEGSVTITTTTVETAPIMTSSSSVNRPQANATIYLTAEPIQNGARISLPIPIPVESQELLNINYSPRTGVTTNNNHGVEANPNHHQSNTGASNSSSPSTASNSTQTAPRPVGVVSGRIPIPFDHYLPCFSPFANYSVSNRGARPVETVPNARIQIRTSRQPDEIRPSNQTNGTSSSSTTHQGRAAEGPAPGAPNDMGLTEVVSNIVGSFFHRNQDQLLNIIPELAINAANQIFGAVPGLSNLNQQANLNHQQRQSSESTPAPQNASSSGSVMMDIDIDDASSSQSESRYHDARDTSSPVAQTSNPAPNVQARMVVQSSPTTSRASESNSYPSNLHYNGHNLVELMQHHPDWIPIIEADIGVMEQQRRETGNRQPFFSDAYLSSIPRKRRRLVAPNSNALIVLQPSPSIAIADLLRRTLTNSTVNHASVDSILESVSSDRELQSAYEDYIKSAVETRLQSDYGFCPEKFVNSSKYFK